MALQDPGRLLLVASTPLPTCSSSPRVPPLRLHSEYSEISEMKIQTTGMLRVCYRATITASVRDDDGLTYDSTYTATTATPRATKKTSKPELTPCSPPEAASCVRRLVAETPPQASPRSSQPYVPPSPTPTSAGNISRISGAAPSRTRRTCAWSQSISSTRP